MESTGNKGLSRQQIARTAVFGALWGVVEVTAGNALHLAKVPFRGVIMALMAVAILACARRFAAYRGSLILIGAIAATFKAGSMGGFVITPMLAIFAEALIAESVFTTMGYGRMTSLIAGILGLLYTFLHGVIMQVFFFGLDIFDVYGNILSEISGSDVNIYILMALLGIAHVIAGAAAGLVGFKIGHKTNQILNSELI